MKRALLAAVALSALLTGAAFAGEKAKGCPPPLPFSGGTPPQPPGGPGLPPPLLAADGNKDGRITHEEVDQSIQADFAGADKDGNGFLDKSEFETGMPNLPPPPDAPPLMPPPPGFADMKRSEPGDLFKRLDWNGDGKLSAEEFAGPRRVMASHADRNADGVISDSDRPQPPKGGHPPR